MSASSGKAGYLVALAAVAALAIGTLASSVVFAGGQGRNLSVCTQACDAMRDMCLAYCGSDCESLYTPGTPEYDACIDDCTTQCTLSKQACKLRCNLRRGCSTCDEPEP